MKNLSIMANSNAEQATDDEGYYDLLSKLNCDASKLVLQNLEINSDIDSDLWCSTNMQVPSNNPKKKQHYHCPTLSQDRVDLNGFTTTEYCLDYCRYRHLPNLQATIGRQIDMLASIGVNMVDAYSSFEHSQIGHILLRPLSNNTSDADNEPIHDIRYIESNSRVDLEDSHFRPLTNEDVIYMQSMADMHRKHINLMNFKYDSAELSDRWCRQLISKQLLVGYNEPAYHVSSEAVDASAPASSESCNSSQDIRLRLDAIPPATDKVSSAAGSKDRLNDLKVNNMCQAMDQDTFDRLYIDSMNGIYPSSRPAASSDHSKRSASSSATKPFVLRHNLVHNAISMLKNISTYGLDPDGTFESNNRAMLEKAFLMIPPTFISDNEDAEVDLHQRDPAVRAFSSTKLRRKNKTSDQATALSQMKTSSQPSVIASEQLAPIPEVRISKSIPHTSKLITSPSKSSTRSTSKTSLQDIPQTKNASERVSDMENEEVDQPLPSTSSHHKSSRLSSSGSKQDESLADDNAGDLSRDALKRLARKRRNERETPPPLTTSNNDNVTRSHKKHRKHHKKDRKHHKKSHRSRSKSKRSKDMKSPKSSKKHSHYHADDGDDNTKYSKDRSDLQAIITSKNLSKYVYEDNLDNNFDLNIRKCLKKVALLTQELEYEKYKIKLEDSISIMRKLTDKDFMMTLNILDYCKKEILFQQQHNDFYINMRKILEKMKRINIIHEDMQYQTHYTIDKRINSQLEKHSRDLRDYAYAECTRLLSMQHINQDTQSLVDFEIPKTPQEPEKCLVLPPHHQLTSETIAAAKETARRRFNRCKTAAQLSTVTLNQPRSTLVAKKMATFLRRQRFIPAKYSSTSYSRLHKSLAVYRRRANNLALRRCSPTANNKPLKLPIMREIINVPCSMYENQIRKEIVQSPRRRYQFIGLSQQLMRTLEVNQNGVLQNIEKFTHILPSKVLTAQIIGINTAIRLINKETAEVERALALYTVLQKHDVARSKCTLIQLDNLPLVKKVSFADLTPELSEQIKQAEDGIIIGLDTDKNDANNILKHQSISYLDVFKDSIKKRQPMNEHLKKIFYRYRKLYQKKNSENSKLRPIRLLFIVDDRVINAVRLTVQTSQRALNVLNYFTNRPHLKECIVHTSHKVEDPGLSIVNRNIVAKTEKIFINQHGRSIHMHK